ncbi:MAG: 3-deoxy-D-manno-octulosonic acid transferase [Chitinophagales bacterium]|nr:3-deoxy-D-manno-octulosonic acid transferase [Chitinophagales bacterium]MDW8427211.1 glycosyltransferase N-terminal domain-containing protein [Chitinophagales bacterium]
MYPIVFDWLYEAVIRIYVLLIHLSALGGGKAALWVKGRRLQQAQLKNLQANEPRIWMHCASAGEYEQGRPLLEALRQKFPDHRIAVTFFSPSGYERCKNDTLADYCFYLPADTARNMRWFLRQLNPRLVVLIKYELWYRLLQQLDRQAIPTAVVSAYFPKNHYLFNPLFSPLLHLLQKNVLWLVQDDATRQLLQKAGCSRVVVCGDARADRVLQVADQHVQLATVEAFVRNDPLLVAGSTWPKDELMVLKAFQRLPRCWKLLVVPHEPHPAHVQRLQRLTRRQAVLYSQAMHPEDSRIMIVDRMGLLAHLYRYATVAYIGGGFNSGIHNLLEAAVYGKPVVFGPRHERFGEAQQLLATGVARSVQNADQLLEAILELSAAPAQQAAAMNRILVQQRSGAAACQAEQLSLLLGPSAT